jgi:hypothetical protein
MRSACSRGSSAGGGQDAGASLILAGNDGGNHQIAVVVFGKAGAVTTDTYELGSSSSSEIMASVQPQPASMFR